jgi:hypothetical protein
VGVDFTIHFGGQASSAWREIGTADRLREGCGECMADNQHMSDLSYPIGKFAPPAEYTPEGRAAAIAQIRETPAHVRDAVRGLTETQRLTPYRDGGWTVAQVVHHLADAHVNGYVRTKWVLTEDRPAVKLYENAKWAAMPDATTASIEDSLLVLDSIHARWAQTLDGVSQDEFAREFIHPVRGPLSLDWNLALYAWHGRHHVAHITRLRDRMGW